MVMIQEKNLGQRAGTLSPPLYDEIVLDTERRLLDVSLPDDVLRKRLDDLEPREPHYRRGYGAMYLEHVLQADEGADFDFLRKIPGEDAETEPLGLLDGWIGGW